VLYFLSKAELSQGEKYMNDYEINEGTLAIMSDEAGKSKILEDNNNYIINQKPYNIIDHSCKYFGSSYEGRKQGSKEIIGANYKLPIIVEDGRNIVFFPTLSAEDEDCMWIAVNKIKKYEEYEYNTTKITFLNNESIIIPLSYRSIQNQIFRATRLSYLLKERKNDK
jgi:competence protein ComK